MTGDEAATGDEAEELEKEIRLALVMNGGVSLAVWMGGVTHELDLLRRASMDDDSGVAENDLRVFGIWRELTQRARARVRIDIVAGTSAGGLNGLLLATTIGRGAPLPNLKDLWVDTASLKTLLPKSSAPKEGGRSVLSGEVFTKAIRDAVTDIGTKQSGEPARCAEPVTLFVTATALDGKSRPFKDSFGHAFDMRDHRRVYRFRDEKVIEYAPVNGTWTFSTRPRREFHGEEAERALVRAARATASFPAAFPPVSEDPLVPYSVRPPNLATASCVMDGGVLNNAPFGPVLDEITRRRLDHPVERVLVYVVPSRGRLADEEVKGLRCGDISPVSVALSGSQYPKEADFRSGTEDLLQQLQTSVRGTRDDLFGRIVRDLAVEQQVREAASELLWEYRRARVKSLLLENLSGQAGAQDCTPLAPPAEADDPVVQTVLDRRNLWLPIGALTELSSPDFVDWRWGLNATIRMLATLVDHLHERLLPTRPCAQPVQPARPNRLLDAASKISELLRHALAVRDAALAERERLSPDATQGALEFVDVINCVHRELNARETLGELVRKAAEEFRKTVRTAAGKARWASAEDVVRVCVAVEVLTRTFAPPSLGVDKLTPKFKFLRLGPDEMGPLFREDWSTDIGDRKLYGTRFGHFGAFIDESWRCSDFAWGRLDAAHYLLPLLLSKDTNEKEEIRLHTAILEAEDPCGATDPSPAQRMRDRLHTLRQEESDITLIDDDAKKKVLRKAGASAIKNLIGGNWTLNGLLRLFWRRTFSRWSGGEGRVSLSAAAGAALRTFAVAIVLGVAAIVVLMILAVLKVIP